jgi:hypothetical protein
MNGQEFRVISAVAILSGTLVIGLEQLSSESINNLVHLTQANPNVKAPANASDQAFGGAGGAIDPRDNSRMDMRQTPGVSASGNLSRMGSPSGLEQGSTDFDSRRDNSRLDTRQERRAPGPASGPSNDSR